MRNLNEYMKSKLALNESIQTKDFATAQAIIKEYLNKYQIWSMPTLEKISTGGKKYYGNLVFNVKRNTAAYILWGEGADMSNSMSIGGVLFFDNATEAINQSNLDQLGKFTSKVNLRTNGVSMAKLLPLIKGVLLGEVKMDEKSLDAAIAGYGVIDESMVEESTLEDVERAYKEKDRAYNRWYALKQKGASKAELDAAEKEYRELTKKWKEAKISIQGGSSVTISNTDNIEPVEQEFEQRLDPKKRFQHMENYINMVLKGISNGLIISGAPGIGKTHRVKKLIKSTGYQLGDNYQLVTGRCTTPALYLALYNYSREDDITLIDDCDDALMDTNSVNILKAALDSGEERILSYFVSRPPEVSEEDAAMRHPELVPDKKGKFWAPNQFEYNGRIIIITNMYAGSLDTALRNRCVVCNLDFTTEETLGIVEELMPNIMPNKLDQQAKELAYKFLCELADKKAEMEISIRSFTTVAKIYAVCGDTEDAQYMCTEQMKLQFARPGKRKRY